MFLYLSEVWLDNHMVFVQENIFALFFCKVNTCFLQELQPYVVKMSTHCFMLLKVALQASFIEMGTNIVLGKFRDLVS